MNAALQCSELYSSLGNLTAEYYLGGFINLVAAMYFQTAKGFAPLQLLHMLGVVQIDSKLASRSSAPNQYRNEGERLPALSVFGTSSVLQKGSSSSDLETD